MTGLSGIADIRRRGTSSQAAKLASQIADGAKGAAARTEDFGRRQPLVLATGAAAVGAAVSGAFAAAARNGARRGVERRATAEGTRASSYGRDNPSGPGYGWPPEPATAA